jgi:hypothetical protein
MKTTFSRGLALIDGKFVHRATKFLNEQIDYSHFRDWFNERGFDMLWYYNSVVYREKEEEQTVIKLFDWLATNGYMTDITEFYDEDERHGFDVSMTARAVQFMHDYSDIMFVAAGSTLLPAIETISNSSAARIHLLSLWENKPGTPSSSMDMKRAVWRAYDLRAVMKEIAANRKSGE